MTDALRDIDLLDVIGMLSAERVSGKLQINTGMTEGGLFFDRGQLVDARLGKLTGFQAVNALASVQDASYEFDPSIAPPAQSSIAPNERRLLKDFFGIEVAGGEQLPDADSTWQDDTAPSRVVPLAAVTEDPSSFASEDDDEATLVRPNPVVAEPRREFAYEPAQYEPAQYEPVPYEPLPYQPQRHERLAASKFRPALFLILLTALIAAAAVALVYRFRKPEATASVTPAVETAPPAEAPQQPATAQPATQATAAVADLRGNWNVVNTVEETSYDAYKNMQIGFNVSINQAGKEFTGTGEKISENGRSLPANGRTPILVKGTINGDRVEATFSETGAVRKTNGRFRWKIDKASGGLTGTFVSTAARTRGKSAATKLARKF